MNFKVFTFLFSSLILAVIADVPTAINYQGRLTDANGAPVTGSKNFTLSIYDGETEGSVLYSEDIGAVTLDDNGVYNFQFGESGTSQATATKSVGVADGIKNVFNTVLPDSAMGVSSIGDGTYTWTPTNGSSSPTSFIGSYDAASKTASAIYIGAAPEAGTDISVIYQNSTGGIAEALASGSGHWLELSIDGVVQQTRQRLLAVPFAAFSGRAAVADSIDESKLTIPTSTLSRLIDEVAFSGVNSSFYRTEDFPSGPLGRNGTVEISSLEMTWDNSGKTMTTRGLRFSYETGGGAGSDQIFPINGPVESISLNAEYPRQRVAARMQFIYVDGSVSDEFVVGTGDTVISNPDPNKVASNVRVWSWQTSGSVDYIRYRGNPNYQSARPRSIVINLSDVNQSTFGLRTMIEGSASAEKLLSNCINWRVIYADSSESQPALIGEELLWSNGSIPKAIKVSTVPDKLGADTIDLSRIVIRLISKN